jgi:hypothetical protein
VNGSADNYVQAKGKSRTDDPESKKDYGKIYLQIVLAFRELESIFEAIKIDPSPETIKELYS